MAINFPTNGGSVAIPAIPTKNGVLPVLAVENAPVKFRDALEAFNTVERWKVVSKNALDILSLEGNVASASFLTISKDPVNDNHETIIESIDTFQMPFRIGIGASMSQRIFGQEFSVEAVSVDDPAVVVPLTPAGAVAVQNIQQATTTLTINFLSPHGLIPGDRFSVYGSDFRVNYPMLTVASVSANGLTLTATAGPQGTIPSQSVGPFTSGFVIKQDPLGYARNGMSYLFEAATTTNTAYFARSEGGSALPSGTILGNHAATLGNSTSVALVTGDRAIAWSPTFSYEMLAQIEAISWFPTAIDNATSLATTVKRTQVIPNPIRDYKIRIRARTLPSFSDVNAKVVSLTKTASAVATVVTEAAHGLTTGDLVQIYGARDQTGFPNLTTAAAVTVVNATTFTVTIGSSTTATSYGGFVSKINAQLSGGFTTNVIQSVSRTSNLLSVVLLAASTGIAVGDMVNLAGVRLATNGSDLGVDGAYRVIAGVGTTTITLEPIIVTMDGVSGNYAPTGANIASTNVGGGIVKRTDFRLHFLRVMQFTRHLVEITGGVSRNDTNGSVPVEVNNQPNVNLSQVGGSTPASTVISGTNRAQGIALAAPANNVDVASAARTSSANSGVIASDFGAAISGNITISAAGGTTPTLDIGLEESYDNGSSWVRIWDAPRATGVTTINIPQIQLGGRRRWVWTIGGTSPTFTFAINTMQGSLAAPVLRQSYNRTLDPNTLNSATPAVSVAGCLQITAKVNLTTLGSPAPAFIMEVSDDGTVWTPVTAAVTPTGTGGTMVGNLQVAAQFARIRTSTAGTGAVLGYASITGVN